MDIFSLEDFKSLALYSENPCVSLYLRMHAKGKETRQNAIRLKNALADAKGALTALYKDGGKHREMLDPIEALLEDGAFWRTQSQGLAIFLARDVTRVFRLPIAFEDLHVIAPRFHLGPALPLITDNPRFYILALAQNSVQFYRCDRLHCEQLQVQNLPKSIDEALQYDLEQRQFQFYTGGPVVRGTHRRAAVFHGQGSSANDVNDNLLRYCRMIDDALYEVLRNETAPLVLAGVDYLQAIFREASDYPHMKPEGVIGNVERVSADELHRQAWEVMSSELRTRRVKGIARYNELKGTGLTFMDLPSILSSAIDGRVAQLIVGERLHRWGSYDENGQEVKIVSDDSPAPGLVDLLDVAACETILKGGEVWRVDPSEIPDKAPAVATLRY
ncbi:MAG: hypothetical protein VR64_23365 [Desulfatitalea sp. BRH_c12]|nr:MAG: hypothetical protein VR64_23365 [Desulfatitalea sp. BRH_c12]